MHAWPRRCPHAADTRNAPWTPRPHDVRVPTSTPSPTERTAPPGDARHAAAHARAGAFTDKVASLLRQRRPEGPQSPVPRRVDASAPPPSPKPPPVAARGASTPPPPGGVRSLLGALAAPVRGSPAKPSASKSLWGKLGSGMKGRSSKAGGTGGSEGAASAPRASADAQAASGDHSAAASAADDAGAAAAAASCSGSATPPVVAAQGSSLLLPAAASITDSFYSYSPARSGPASCGSSPFMAPRACYEETLDLRQVSDAARQAPKTCPASC